MPETFATLALIVLGAGCPAIRSSFVPANEINRPHSLDVEYVRNIIVHDYNSNEIARDLFNNKVKRSYERSPKLKSKTFARYREVQVGGQNTAIVPANRTRYNRVMRGVASALYFEEFGKRFTYHWNVHPVCCKSDKTADRFSPGMFPLLHPRINT